MGLGGGLFVFPRKWGDGGASNTFACKRPAPPPKKLLLLSFFVGLPLEIYFTSSYRMKYFFIPKEEGKKKNMGFLILWHNFRFKQRFIENQINVENLAYVRWQMSAACCCCWGETWILTNAAVSVATEDVALIAITFIHFIMNVVAILITRIPIFTTTCN